MEELSLRKDGEINIYKKDEMSKKFYLENEEFFYCPNLNCNARVGYAEGPIRRFIFTLDQVIDNGEIHEQHIETCPYYINRENGKNGRRRYDASILVGLSLKHRDSALKRGYKKFVDPEFGKSTPNGNKKNKKNEIKPTEIDESLPPRGKITTAIVAEDIEKKAKETPIFQRNINDIGDSDYYQIRTVSGIVKKYAKHDTYKSLELETKNGKTARVFFGEAYRVNNEAQYGQIDSYFQYIEQCWKNKDDVVLVCIGEIRKDDYDISIAVSDYHDVSLNNNTHYQVFNLMNSLI